MQTLFKKIIQIILLTIPFTQVFSQEKVAIPIIQGEIKYDGIVDDQSWQMITPLPMVMHTPVFGNSPTEKSEIMICYDNTYLYIGARLFDSN